MVAVVVVSAAVDVAVDVAEAVAVVALVDAVATIRAPRITLWVRVGLQGGVVAWG